MDQPTKDLGGGNVVTNRRGEGDVPRILWVPLDSMTWRSLPVPLPSQAFVFDLLRQALARELPVLVTRGWAPWVWHVPELFVHRDVVRLRNPRWVAITAGKMSEGVWSVVARWVRVIDPKLRDCHIDAVRSGPWAGRQSIHSSGVLDPRQGLASCGEARRLVGTSEARLPRGS